MPELPEVEIYRRYFEGSSLGKKIKDVEVKDQRILKIEKRKFIKILQDNIFRSVIRHGKYLFIECDSIYLVMHFGMTGDLEYFLSLNHLM